MPDEANVPDWCEIGESRIAVDGRKVKKVMVNHAKEIPDIRGEDHYEAATSYSRRYWIDRIKEVPDVDYNAMCIDIESASDGEKLTRYSIKQAQIPILVIGVRMGDTVVQFCWNADTNLSIKTKRREVKCYRTEETMLTSFFNWIAKVRPDIIYGFNNLGYDIPYILYRANVLGIKPHKISPIGYAGVGKNGDCRIKGVALFDLMKGYLRLARRQYTRNTLNDVLERELGIAKYKGLDVRYLKKAWESDPYEVLEYNFIDVDHTFLLEQEMGIMATHVAFHQVFRCNLEDTLHSGGMVEDHMCSEMPQFIYPSSKNNIKYGTIKGAEPRAPKVGLHKNIVMVDLTSAYPFSMISCNMSPETIIRHPEDCSDEYLATCINVNGVYFKSHDEQLGAYVSYLMKMFAEKDKWSKVRSQCKYKSREWKLANWRREAYKVGINTVYGNTGYDKCKMYNVDIANSVTFVIRGVIYTCEHEVNKLGHDKIFGHTDSVGFVAQTSDLKELIAIGEAAKKHLNELFPMHLRRYNVPYERAQMYVDFEKIAWNGIFSGKTRYAVNLRWIDGKEIPEDDPYIEIKGFEAIRSDSSKLARRLQESLIKDILNGKTKREIDAKYSVEISKVRDKQYPLEEIGVPAEFKKEFSLYPKSYYRVTAAEWSNKYLNTSFGIGDKPFFIPISTNGEHENATTAAVDEDTVIPEWLTVDYKKMAKQTVAKLGFLYSAMGWDPISLSGQKSLFDFTSEE